ncbi:dephospho-CoA kinase [Synechococcus sp. CC9616]|uniref:dephospho-CoA kinase n=1 Tax=Synechococcus sp. CC9616 TaxID=110663 RepID=UPI000491A09B|nr:dephospho-CoA kinase [Synechococcus sp. CC9616]
MQRRIGLTGGIASGKSRVGRLLEAYGWPVLDADSYAREALAAGSDATLEVLKRWGDAVRAPDEPLGLNRAALGRIVFSEIEARRWLEQLVHPVVRRRFEQDLKGLSEAPCIVLMIPLLFEAGQTDLCSEVWLVDCEEEQQLERLMQRDGLSEKEAQLRIKAQWPLSRKRPLADRIIDNRGPDTALNETVKALLAAG